MDQYDEIEYEMRFNNSPWDFLFNPQPTFTWEEIAVATREHRYKMAIYYIKQQPFY